MQISHLGKNINSSSSDHSLWHQIDYQNSGRGRWRNTDSEDDRQNMNQGGGEGAVDISVGVIRKACDEEDKTWTLCTQAYCTPIQTNNSTSLGCTLKINTHLFFSLSKPNFSTSLWQTGSLTAPRSHEEVTMVKPWSSTVQMWPLASVPFPSIELFGCLFCYRMCQMVIVTFI